MSQLTQCNFCSYQRMLADARRCGMKITKLPEDFGMGGVGVYMHPKNVKIKDLSPEQRKKFHRAWFMELGDSCCC